MAASPHNQHCRRKERDRETEKERQRKKQTGRERERERERERDYPCRNDNIIHLLLIFFISVVKPGVYMVKVVLSIKETFIPEYPDHTAQVFVDNISTCLKHMSHPFSKEVLMHLRQLSTHVTLCSSRRVRRPNLLTTLAFSANAWISIHHDSFESLTADNLWIHFMG